MGADNYLNDLYLRGAVTLRRRSEKLTVVEINALIEARTIDAFIAAIPADFPADVKLIATLAHSLGMKRGQKLEREFPRQPEGN